MSEYSGSALVFQWINPAGTLAITGDQRRVSVSPSIDLIENTAGSDEYKGYVDGPKDGKISYEGVKQSGGTAAEDALREGTHGTIILGPEGTATGMRKSTYPAISMGPNDEFPYADLAIMSVEFQQNGAPTHSVY